MNSAPIPFNKPLLSGRESEVLHRLIQGGSFSGAGPFAKSCENLIREALKSKAALLVPSCTAALEMAALLLNLERGDEVIMPSYTFVSTANAFALRGVRICFVDVEPETMTPSASSIEAAVNLNTKVIVTVPYNGVHTDYSKIENLVKDRKLFWIEDSAQAWGATFQGRPFGSFGDFGALSFHETKNIHCGEGGCLLINNSDFIESALICRDKGTNRSRFLRGEVDKYTWQALGSSYLPSEFQAAFLKCQIEFSPQVTAHRVRIWHRYSARMRELETSGKIELQTLPEHSKTNGHLFLLKTKNAEERLRLKAHLHSNGIQTATHYEPLHTSPGGLRFGYFLGEDIHTTSHSERLLRLPLFFDLTLDQVDRICDEVLAFFRAI